MKHRHAWLACVTVALLLSTSVASCGPAEPTEAPAVPTEAPGGPSEEGERVLVIAYPETPAELDVDLLGGLGGEDILVNAYDAGFNYRIADLPEGVPGTQISLPGDEGVEGGLFESWEFSEDETVITLHIRRGVQSYFGNEFTSDDFVWRVNRAWNTGFIGRFQYEAAGITDPSDVRVIDDYTLEITTPNGPNPVFFKSLATVYAAPVDADELLENWVTDEDPWAVDAFRQHTFGYGPYHLESCTPGTGCTLVANPNYWRGRPYWDRIVWREVPDASARYALLQSGEVQYVFNSLTYEQMSQLREGPQDEAALFEVRQGNEGIYFAMNVTQPPFDNPQLRQAVAYAVPYDDIVNIAYRGFGVLAESIVPSMYTDADMDAWTYEQDLERAQELWETAGGPDTFEIMVDSSRPVDQDAAVLIKTSLAEIGVTANIRSVPTAAFWEAFNGKTHQSLITMSLAFVADANYCGFLIFHGGGGLNAAGYSNAEVDRLIDDSLVRAPDDPLRTEDASAWQAVAAEEVPEIPMIYHGFAVGLSRGLTGTVWYFDNHARWNDLRWSE